MLSEHETKNRSVNDINKKLEDNPLNSEKLECNEKFPKNAESLEILAPQFPRDSGSKIELTSDDERTESNATNWPCYKDDFSSDAKENSEKLKYSKKDKDSKQRGKNKKIS